MKGKQSVISLIVIRIIVDNYILLGIGCSSYRKNQKISGLYFLPDLCFLQNPAKTGRSIFACPKKPKILWEYHILKGFIEGNWNGCIWASTIIDKKRKCLFWFLGRFL